MLNSFTPFKSLINQEEILITYLVLMHNINYYGTKDENPTSSKSQKNNTLRHN